MKTTNKKWFYIRRGIAIGLLALLLLLIPLSVAAQTYVKDDYTWVMDGTTSVAVRVYDRSSNSYFPQYYHSSYTTDGITRHLYSLPDDAPFAPAKGVWFQIEWSVDLANSSLASFTGNGRRIEFVYFVRDGYDYFGIDYVMDGDALNPGKSSFVRFGNKKIYLEEAVEVRKYGNYTGYRYSVPCPDGTVSVDEIYFSAFYHGNGNASVWSNCFSDVYLRSYTDDPLVGETFEPLPDKDAMNDYLEQEQAFLDSLNYEAVDNALSNSMDSYSSLMTGMLSLKGMYNALMTRIPPFRSLVSISISLGLAAFVLNLVVVGIRSFTGGKKG